MPEVWKKCSTCKKDLLTNQIYFICSVSTCRTKATNYLFCSVACWDTHVPVERHRGDTAAAIEKRAPSQIPPEGQEPKRIVVSDAGKSSVEEEILVVVTKIRKYISEKSGLSTSAGVYEALTERVKRICDRSIEEAKRQGRKTVMDRDVP